MEVKLFLTLFILFIINKFINLNEKLNLRKPSVSPAAPQVNIYCNRTLFKNSMQFDSKKMRKNNTNSMLRGVLLSSVLDLSSFNENLSAFQCNRKSKSGCFVSPKICDTI